jgi:uncharacterized SAM-binding protein YcdF (DUF218 family)
MIALGFSIVEAGEQSSRATADVAVILGAAVYHDRPSPVFEERIRHGIGLYKAARVKKLLFTGGRSKEAPHAESEVGRAYATRRGVPAQAILIETASRTTLRNLKEARRVMEQGSLRTALVVSDPLHMKRALRMCEGLDIRCAGSPTPTTRYRTWRSKAGFLAREIYFYNFYLVFGQ